jgi:Domain of unknown function (DUF397)
MHEGVALTDNRVPQSPEDGDGWFVSSFSNGAGSCVEVKFADRGAILVRDSKDQRHDRPIIGMPSLAWGALMASLTK